MQNHIAGLFKQEQNLGEASQALRLAGFTSDSIKVLARKPHNAPLHKDRVQAPAVGRSALLGALSLGLAGALLGLIIGLGIIPLPGVDPAVLRSNPVSVLSSALIGFAWGAATGAILGTAVRLLGSRDKVRITSRGVKRGGLLLVVPAGDRQREEAARRILRENGAVDVQNLTDKWDLSVWSDFNELPSTAEGGDPAIPRGPRGIS